jgi:hypothetical protein
MSAREELWTKGTALQAAEKLALFEGYGLQAVHNCCVMNPALAAEGCFLHKIGIFPQPV